MEQYEETKVDCPLEKPLEARKFDDYHSGRRGTEGWYLVRANLALVHFVGTDHPVDILTDVLACKTRTGIKGIPNHVRVHLGFWRYALRATAIVRGILRRNPRVQYLELSGHSLGAAIALLVAMALKAKEPKRLVWVSMYGGPPVVGARSRKWIRRNVVAGSSEDIHRAALDGKTISGITRFRTPFDAVAGLISVMWVFGYIHVVSPVVLKLNRKFQFRVRRLWEDHMKSAYCEGLRNI